MKRSNLKIVKINKSKKLFNYEKNTLESLAPSLS